MTTIIDSLITPNQDLIKKIDSLSKRVKTHLEDSMSLTLEGLIDKSFSSKSDYLENKDKDLAEILWLEDGAKKIALFKSEIREDYPREGLELVKEVENDLKSLAMLLRATYYIEIGLASNNHTEKITKITEGYKLYTSIVQSYWKYLYPETRDAFKKIAFNFLNKKEDVEQFLKTPDSLSEKSNNFLWNWYRSINKKREANLISQVNQEIVSNFVETQNAFSEAVLEASKKWKVLRPTLKDSQKLISTMESWSNRFDDDEMYETLRFLEKSEDDSSP